MKAYVFPGQGSQKKGMGENLFDKFNELTAKADSILGYSLRDLCLEDPEEKLGFTQYTQPALFSINALSYLDKIDEEGQKPDFVAGHSLGEYNALFASGAFDFETGVKLVQKRGELMSKASEGGMAAVMGLSGEKIDDILAANGLDQLSIANYNSPAQIVIAGAKDQIEKAQSLFEDAGAKRYIILNVSAAFHSPFMENARGEFEGFLNDFQFSALEIPVISNVNAQPYQKEDIAQNLVKQITHPVRWVASMQLLLSKGEIEIKEVGPGKVLTGLLRAIKKV